MSLENGCRNRNAVSESVQGDTIFAEDFEAGTLKAWTDGYDPHRQRIVSNPGFAQSGSRYLEVTYVAGGDGGWLTHFFMPGYDSLYVSYYVQLPPDWQGGTKLLALYGSRTDDQWSAIGKAGKCPTGRDFFATMVIAEQTGNPGPARFYTYYPDMVREGDGITCWGRYGDSSETYTPPLELSRGVWHRVEFWVKLNDPFRSNGTQMFWIDGVLRGVWPRFRFRNSDMLRLNSVQLTFNRGISGGPNTQVLWVDNLLVAIRRPAS